MYGYRAVRVGGRSGGMNQEPDPVTSPRLISILKAYVEGGSAHAARWAMAKKIPAPYGGENWNASQVYMLVKRVDAYATGENTVTVEGQPFTYKFKPIVPKDLYRAVVTRQKEHKVTPRAVMMTTGYARELRVPKRRWSKHCPSDASWAEDPAVSGLFEADEGSGNRRREATLQARASSDYNPLTKWESPRGAS